jgi:hypothetical protein
MIITNPQKGIASLALLAMIVFGILIMWEMNSYIDSFNSPLTEAIASPKPDSAGPPICLTGETDNCNDSNDAFLLN